MPPLVMPFLHYYLSLCLLFSLFSPCVSHDSKRESSFLHDCSTCLVSSILPSAVFIPSSFPPMFPLFSLSLRCRLSGLDPVLSAYALCHEIDGRVLGWGLSSLYVTCLVSVA